MRLCQVTLLLGIAIPAAAAANDLSPHQNTPLGSSSSASSSDPSTFSNPSNLDPSSNENIAPGSSVLLIWTSPGDDGRVGSASKFDLRYSRNPITASNFNNATRVGFVIDPGMPGAMMQMTVAGLQPGSSYYFAIKTADERPNWSAISNVAYWDGGTTAVQLTGPTIEMSQVWPNPARGSTQFTLKLAYEQDVRIEIFDVTGRRVRILVDRQLQGGVQDFTWNFRDDVGRRLDRGVYLMRAQIGTNSFTRRIVAVE